VVEQITNINLPLGLLNNIGAGIQNKLTEIGKYIQYLVITYDEKQYEKEYIQIDIHIDI